jgi:putative transcriptional regulator
MKRKQQKTARTRMKRRAAHKLPASKHDWREFDALTDADILKAARSDPDAQPLNEAQLRRMNRPNPKVVRQALGLSQEEFAERFRIPVGTLRDWEQGRVEPDQAARAYLMVIARNPKAVREALEPAV